ncbi:SAM-dependent methyltransferase [Nocardiopsis tropica]|uniref:SAM-dependent methyltransferase n=1 Tax=Nocardiopsis tropica TaxID=109330 RepID=A0ABU7KVM5_9ACTN|nr:SAM-dependent methyltransferase [Nocardiopsis umidischolae]MEE2053365.1 SAM-dependent methyltransferase [Nocardiopsis umidischolae]
MADRFPPDIDMETPSIARMYDYLLGGKDNFEADRKACEVLAAGTPELVSFANDNRAYLSRAVEHVAAQGVDQFLDLGAGLPTANNTHHVAQRANPRARVVYVDHDPIVLAHGRALINDSAETAFLLSDIRETDRVLGAPETRRLIDTDLPVCVMLVSLLHCLPDHDDPFGMVHRLMERLAPGSCVIFSHIVSDDPASGAWMTDQILSFGTPWGRVRSPEEASAVFQGLELASPWTDGREDGGPRAVDCASWRHPDVPPRFRPEDPGVKLWELSGVAFKR